MLINNSSKRASSSELEQVIKTNEFGLKQFEIIQLEVNFLHVLMNYNEFELNNLVKRKQELKDRYIKTDSIFEPV